MPSFIMDLPLSEVSRSHSAQQHPLGTRGVLTDGRQFVYGENGAAAMVAGTLCQSEVPNANLDELAVAAAAAADALAISVTLGSQALTEDLLREGYVNIEDDAGEGRVHQVRQHDAASASTAVTINLMPGHAIAEALTTSTTVGLTKHPYKDIIIHPSPATALLVGVPIHDIAANEFGWWQTKGPCSVLTDTTVVINEAVTDSPNVDGAVFPFTLTEGTPNTGGGQNIAGYVQEVAGNEEHSLVYLTLY